MNGVKARPLAAGCVLTIVLTGGCAHRVPVSEPAPAVPAATAAIQSVPEAPACHDSGVTSVARSTGDALRTLMGGSAADDGMNFVLPASVRSQFPEVRAGEVAGSGGGPEDLNSAYHRAFEAGAFVYGHPYFKAQLSNSSRQTVTIYDVRPANLRTLCLPSGLLAMYGSEGGDDVPLEFDLDADRPIARVAPGQEEEAGLPYFEAHTIEIAPAGTAWLYATFTLAKRARSFDMAISYASGGRKYVQVFKNGSQPFRAMPATCPHADDRDRLSDLDVQRLASHRFDEVLVQGELSSQGLPTMKEEDPSTFAANCVTR
jgi:hypothetical protein